MATCYRHPGRETGVSCSSCGRPICPDCMTTTSVGMRCPECARDRTPVRTLRSLETAPVLTYVLIGVNVAVALGAFLSGAGVGGGAGGSSLIARGELVGPLVAQGEWWRLVTSGFLHAGIFHVLLNMLGLYFLGTMLEPMLGRRRFGALYLVSLLAGSFGVMLVSPNSPTVGASGAIFGLLGAAFVLMRARGVNPMETGLGVVILLNVVISIRPGISLGAHIGGLIGGGIVAGIFTLNDRRAMPRAVPEVLVGALGAVVVAGSIALASAAV